MADVADDDDPDTAWKVGAFSDVRGEWIQARSTTGPITTDHIGVLQAERATNRFVTKARLSFDGGKPVTQTLDPESATMQVMELQHPVKAATVRLTIVTTTDAGTAGFDYAPISEVSVA